MNDLDADWTPDEVEAALAADDVEYLVLAPIRASLSPCDGAWSLAVCVRLARHRDPRVRCNALTALGHLARQGDGGDLAAIRPVIEAGLSDSDERVRNGANSAADDAEHFLGWDFGRPDPERGWARGREVPGVSFRRGERLRVLPGWWHAGTVGVASAVRLDGPEPRYDLDSVENLGFDSPLVVDVPQSALVRTAED